MLYRQILNAQLLFIKKYSILFVVLYLLKSHGGTA